MAEIFYLEDLFEQILQNVHWSESKAGLAMASVKIMYEVVSSQLFVFVTIWSKPKKKPR